MLTGAAKKKQKTLMPRGDEPENLFLQGCLWEGALTQGPGNWVGESMPGGTMPGSKEGKT